MKQDQPEDLDLVEALYSDGGGIKELLPVPVAALASSIESNWNDMANSHLRANALLALLKAQIDEIAEDGYGMEGLVRAVGTFHKEMDRLLCANSTATRLLMHRSGAKMFKIVAGDLMPEDYDTRGDPIPALPSKPTERGEKKRVPRKPKQQQLEVKAAEPGVAALGTA